MLADVPDVEVHGDPDGLLMVSWGGTYGAVRSAVDAARSQGIRAGHVHLRWLSPLPANLEATMRRYAQVLVAELNLGQLARYLRAEYLLPVHSYAKIQGQPFKVSELLARIQILAG